MLFRKRRKPSPAREQWNAAAAAKTFQVDYEMMQKGAEIKRGGKMVRQFAVMIRGSITLVTSGDRVDEEIWQALLAAGAVLPAPEAPEEAAQATPPAPDAEESREEG